VRRGRKDLAGGCPCEEIREPCVRRRLCHAATHRCYVNCTASPPCTRRRPRHAQHGIYGIYAMRASIGRAGICLAGTAMIGFKDAGICRSALPVGMSHVSRFKCTRIWPEGIPMRIFKCTSNEKNLDKRMKSYFTHMEIKNSFRRKHSLGSGKKIRSST